MSAMLRIYFGLAGTLLTSLLVGCSYLPPSGVLGFQATSHFDSAFIVMTAGTLLTAIQFGFWAVSGAGPL